MKNVFFVMNRCLGCEECVEACAREHNWKPRNKVVWVANHTVPVQLRCLHCDEAPCIEVCPVEAIERRDDGIVLIDDEKCIGCTGCTLVCPYGAPRYDPESKKALKCDLCRHRIDSDQNLVPACVEVCPTQALLFGEKEELEASCHESARSRLTDETKGRFLRRVVLPLEG